MILNKKSAVICVCLAMIIAGILRIAIHYFNPTVVTISGLMASVSEQELILNSDIIITGEVLELEKSKWSNPDNEIPGKRNVLQTDVIIKVDKIISGEYKNETVAVRIGKGYDKKSNTKVLCNMYPDFSTDEKVLLFLSRDDGDLATDEDYFVLTGMKQGKFIINDDKTLKSGNDQYNIKTIPELEQRIAIEKQNNPDWKEKKAAEAERTRIENAKLFGE